MLKRKGKIKTTMKKYNIFIVLTVFFISINPVFSKDFGPVKSDVKVGDNREECTITVSRIRKPTKNKYYLTNAPKAFGYFLIRFFQIVISSQDGANCRFHPTCSRYGKESVETHGLVIGSLLAGDRIIRCNPYNEPGDDPVPEKVFGGFE